MSRGVNKVILIGRLGADPEVRHTAGGNAVANLSVATSERWRDKASGEMVEKTEWHKVVLFGRLAEVAGEYLTKGAPVYVEGRLQTRKWEDREGVERWTTEIVGSDMQMLGGRSGSGAPANAPAGGAPRERPAPSPGARDRRPPPPAEHGDLEDDIPF